MMFALVGGLTEINVRAIVMAQKMTTSGHWRLFLLDDKVIDVTFAEFDLIRPMLAETAVNLSLGPMHGTLQILPGA